MSNKIQVKQTKIAAKPKRKTAKRKPLPPMRLTQRTWDQEKVMEYLCDKLMSSAMGMGAILNHAPHDMPKRQTVLRWMADNKDHRDIYARAREAQADYLAEEILTIADDSTNDYMLMKNSDGEEREVLNTEHVQRSKLRIDSRKWLAGKLSPRKYGEVKQQEIDVNLHLTIDDLAKQIANERVVN